jgi:carboxylesterase
VRRAREALPKVMAPTLVIQSREDNRIAPAAAAAAFARLGARERRMEWITGSGHVITVDYKREQVAQDVGSWMDAHLAASAFTRPL